MYSFQESRDLREKKRDRNEKKRIEERTAVTGRDFLIHGITMQLRVRSDPSWSPTACKKAKEMCPVRVGAGSISAELPFISFGPTV